MPRLRLALAKLAEARLTPRAVEDLPSKAGTCRTIFFARITCYSRRYEVPSCFDADRRGAASLAQDCLGAGRRAPLKRRLWKIFGMPFANISTSPGNWPVSRIDQGSGDPGVTRAEDTRGPSPSGGQGPGKGRILCRPTRQAHRHDRRKADRNHSKARSGGRAHYGAALSRMPASRRSNFANFSEPARNPAGRGRAPRSRPSRGLKPALHAPLGVYPCPSAARRISSRAGRENPG